MKHTETSSLPFAAAATTSEHKCTGTEQKAALQQNSADLVHAVVEFLKKSSTSITVMESCTSGLIASMITDTEGASQIFPGGYITYANDAKIAAGVDAQVIASYGVYSAECAEAMARAAQHAFRTDIAIGVTGTTGNIDPNNADSVQGEAYYCIVIGTTAHSFHLLQNVSGLTRHEIKQQYADDVFRQLSLLIKKIR